MAIAQGCDTQPPSPPPAPSPSIWKSWVSSSSWTDNVDIHHYGSIYILWWDWMCAVGQRRLMALTIVVGFCELLVLHRTRCSYSSNACNSPCIVYWTTKHKGFENPNISLNSNTEWSPFTLVFSVLVRGFYRITSRPVLLLWDWLVESDAKPQFISLAAHWPMLTCQGCGRSLLHQLTADPCWLSWPPFNFIRW